MTNISQLQLIKFDSFINYNGILIPLQTGKIVPFPIVRVYYVYRIKKGQSRGKHAHKKCRQLLISLQGKCEVSCTDGKIKKTFVLDKPTIGLFVPALIWTVQKFITDNAILLVLADSKYNENDYLRNYQNFLKSK